LISRDHSGLSAPVRRTLILLPLLASCTFLLPSLQTPPPCPTGTVLCNNLTCSDLKTDPFNCGFCENVCGQGLSCKTIPDDGGSACLCTIPGGLFQNGICYNLAGDPNNCGQIGLACAPTQVCVNGLCGCAGIDAGLVTECIEDGGPVCANLSSDQHRCGSCTNDCGDLGVCSLGMCVDGGIEDGGASDAGADGGLSDGGDAGMSDGGDAGTFDGGDGGSGGP
jgi:hypothetical protein